LKPTLSPNQQTGLLLLETIVQDKGLPDELVTDNTKCFTAPRIASVCHRNGVKQLFSTAYHPQAKGKAERHVKLVKQMPARLCSPDQQSQWDEFKVARAACKKRTQQYKQHNKHNHIPTHCFDPHFQLSLLHTMLEAPT